MSCFNSCSFLLNFIVIWSLSETALCAFLIYPVQSLIYVGCALAGWSSAISYVIASTVISRYRLLLIFLHCTGLNRKAFFKMGEFFKMAFFLQPSYHFLCTHRREKRKAPDRSSQDLVLMYIKHFIERHIEKFKTDVNNFFVWKLVENYFLLLDFEIAATIDIFNSVGIYVNWTTN